MSHETEKVSGVNGVALTNEEQKLLFSLLKHPKIQDLAKEIEDSEKKEDK